MGEGIRESIYLFSKHAVEVNRGEPSVSLHIHHPAAQIAEALGRLKCQQLVDQILFVVSDTAAAMPHRRLYENIINNNIRKIYGNYY